MHKITILLLLIGSAVMVIGLQRYDPVEDNNNTPWTVEHTASNEIKILGITLGKSRLKDVMIHFSKSGKNYVVKNANQSLSLISVYEGLTIDGLVANIELHYTIPQATLNSVIAQQQVPQNVDKILLSSQQSHLLSDATVQRLTYYPSIDYDEAEVLQRFGLPDNKRSIDQDIQRWRYKDMHLYFYLNKKGFDKLVYMADMPSD